VRAFTVVAAVAAGLALAGCTWPVAQPGPVTDHRLDVAHGTVDGIGVGSSVEQVTARLGEPSSGPDYAAPADERPGFHGPFAFAIPPGLAGPPHVLRYPGLAFVAAEGEVFAVIGGRGARTGDGARVGDPLASARRTYPDLRCQQQADGEPIPPLDASTYPECRMRLGDLRLVVAGDPIASISVIALRRNGAACATGVVDDYLRDGRFDRRWPSDCARAALATLDGSLSEYSQLPAALEALAAARP
jgi:hypothetical protein